MHGLKSLGGEISGFLVAGGKLFFRDRWREFFQIKRTKAKRRVGGIEALGSRIHHPERAAAVLAVRWGEMAASPPRQKPRFAAVPDALASLPLEVLDNIFSRLHIYDVVRTSVLSRAWRRRWESLPTVDLSHSPGICASDIDALLLRRGSAPVRAFRLPARDPSWMAFNYFHDWLLRLSRRGVRDLTLGFPSRFGLLQLHSCLFSCRELTRLSLTNCRIPPAPAGLAGFPNLKTLRLEKVVVAAQEHAGKGFAALIAASPVLEDVEMVCVVLVGDGPDDEWVIRAPNLRKLSILGAFKYGGVTESLPLLEEAIFFGTNCAKFLTGMAGITKTSASFPFG